MNNIVAIIGRPNVGKSTLFNRLTKSRKAIVDSFSGVTRDRHYGHSDWNGINFTLIDTGGYLSDSKNVFDIEIKKQVIIAINESDAIIFLVDVETGPTNLDIDVAQLLQKTNKPVFLTVNKVDNSTRVKESLEFYNLGLGDYFSISSINGSGTGELLDSLVSSFKINNEEEELDIPKIAIVGKPNVGKSSFVNALLNENKNIVTDISGTTRDTIDSSYNKYGKKIILIDTAGLRKKSKVFDNLEFYSVMRTIRAIERSDICLIIIDAINGFKSQDLNIFKLAKKNNKGVIVLVNKWDIVKNKNDHATENYKNSIYNKTAPYVDFKIIFISSLNKQRIYNAIDETQKIYHKLRKKIPTSELNDFLLKKIESTPPPSYKGKRVKIKYITKLPTKATSFAFFCNLPQYIKEGYKRYLENQIRKKYDFTGIPINIYIRKK